MGSGRTDQKLGVVGGTVQAQRLQQLATFATQRSTLEPVARDEQFGSAAKKEATPLNGYKIPNIIAGRIIDIFKFIDIRVKDIL